MLSTKHLVHDVHAVPIPWIFEHFGRLPYKLSGQDIKIRSIWNPKDRTPSMCIYVDQKGTYRFKDFSTGRQGSAIDLVKELYNEEFFAAAQRIITAYNDYVLHNNGGYDVDEFKQQSKYQVCSYESRSWNTRDQYYWTQFNIGSRILEHYNVRPLQSYTMCKQEEGQEDKFLEISSNYLYGYFRSNGELYKIYQPKVAEKKFIKVGSYLQGQDQLTGKPNLMIVSSLKDLMSFRSLKITDYDFVAPDSENSMIPKSTMEEFLKNYYNIHIILDNDEAGRKAAAKYTSMYDCTSFNLDMSKDIADSVRDHGPKAVRSELMSLIRPENELALQV